MAVDSANEELHFSLLKAIAMLMGIVPSLFGVAWGVREAAIGICVAAETRLELSAAIMPMAFANASLIYAIITFFMFKNEPVTSYEQGFGSIMACTISGMGGLLSAYAVGGITRYSCVTKAQQKKFSTQFFLMMIFAELIAIFALIMALLCRSPK